MRGEEQPPASQLQLLHLLQAHPRQQIAHFEFRQKGQVVDAHDALLLEGLCQGSARLVGADFEGDEGVCERLLQRDGVSQEENEAAAEVKVGASEAAAGAAACASPGEVRKLTKSGRRLLTITSVPVGVMVAAATSHELAPLTTTSFSSSNALTSSRLTPSPMGTTNWMPLVNAPAAASLVLNDVGATHT